MKQKQNRHGKTGGSGINLVAPGNEVVSPARGFTLIELLTVIAIIGLLAGMIVGLGPVAARKMRMSRVQGEMQQLITAIESFQAKMGFYPPDNVVSRIPLVVNDGTNQLFYELTGWTYSSVNMSQQSALERNSVFYPNTCKKYFNTTTFANSSTNGGSTYNFLPTLKTNQVRRLPLNSPQVEVLVVPVAKPGVVINPWHYRSTNPTNNPGKYDLWAEIPWGKETRIISNWGN